MNGLENFTGGAAVETEVLTGQSRYADSPYIIPGVDEALAEHALAMPIAQVDSDRKLVDEETAWKKQAICGRFVELVKAKVKGKNNSDKYYIVLQAVNKETLEPIEDSYVRIQAPGQLQKAVENGKLVRNRYAEILYLGKLASTQEGDDAEYHSFMIRGAKSTTATH